MPITPPTLFADALKLGASDVHIAVGSPILFRVNGVLQPQGETGVEAADAEKFVKTVVGENGWKRLQEKRELDTAYELADGVRLRVNVHYERGMVGLAARIVPSTIPSVEDLGLQNIAQQFCMQKEGLILFTGPTGAGKSTSLASLIRFIDAQRPCHVITLEDPIEFVFTETNGLIAQREYGSDFLSFPDALRSVLRQDPDVVMVGEMRDPESIAAALTLAETGHLILATLHTPNTIQTIDRIVDVFPSHQQAQIRSQLSLSLRAIIAQRLLPAVAGGRVAQREILVNTPAVSHIIRDNRLPELESVLQTGTENGMMSFEKDGKRLYKEGVIAKEVYESAMG